MKEAGVPTVMHIVQQVDHGFDLFVPKLSPSAHVAYYDIERFLGVMACDVKAEGDPIATTAITAFGG